MRGQLYVLGTSHDFQCGSAKCSPTQIAAFQAELGRIFETHHIRCVAEEMDDEGLREYNVDSTIAQRLASSLNIEHHHVDLTTEARRLTGSFRIGKDVQPRNKVPAGLEQHSR